jgi:NADH-quinone oxidoreductase subunit E
MLTADLRAEIAALAAHAPTRRAACIDALKSVQARLRYVDDAALAETAALLDMPPAELDEVATFYNLIFRRPVGETVLLLCNSITCWMLGAEERSAHICARLGIKPGGTSADGRFTLLPIVCLGHCDHAPAMLAGETLIGDVTMAQLDALLEKQE